MPVLHLKNKITRSLINTVEQALAAGGIPDYIALTPKEGLSLLKEVQELETVKPHFRFEQDNDVFAPEEPDVRFLLARSDHDTRKLMLERWYVKQYTVSYIHTKKKENQLHAQLLMKSEDDILMIPLRILNPKPEDKQGAEKDSKPST